MSTFVTLGVPYSGDTVWYFGLNKETEHSSVKLPWLKSSTLFTKLNNLLHFGDVVCTKQFSLVIQTFERTYKSLITASYCLGLHNSLSFYIYIFFIAGYSRAFIFVLPGPKCIKVYPKRQLQTYNKLYTNRWQFLRFLDRLHCLKMLWYEHLVQLLCFYPPTASSRALMKFSSCLALRSPNCCKH